MAQRGWGGKKKKIFLRKIGHFWTFFTMTWTHKIANYVVIYILEHIRVYDIGYIWERRYCPHTHPGKARGTSFIFWGSVGYVKNICYFFWHYFAWPFFIISRQNYSYFTKTYYNIDRNFVKLTEVKPVENSAKITVDFMVKMRYNKSMEMARRIATSQAKSVN